MKKIEFTHEEKNELFVEVLKVWESRADNLRFPEGSKKRTELQLEFLTGVVATLDYLQDAKETGESSVPPQMWVAAIRGEYVTIADFEPKKEEHPIMGDFDENGDCI
jgi:hypothetical protein